LAKQVPVFGKQVLVSDKSFHRHSPRYQFHENGYPFLDSAPAFPRKPSPISTHPTSKPGFPPSETDQAVSAKHTALGATSPLGNLKWTEISPALAPAKTPGAAAAADLAQQPAKEYRAPYVTMPKVTHALRDARAILLVANRETPKAPATSATSSTIRPQAKAKPKPASLKPMGG
jgi:hypothetical protein